MQNFIIFFFSSCCFAYAIEDTAAQNVWMELIKNQKLLLFFGAFFILLILFVIYKWKLYIKLPGGGELRADPSPNPPTPELPEKGKVPDFTSNNNPTQAQKVLPTGEVFLNKKVPLQGECAGLYLQLVKGQETNGKWGGHRYRAIIQGNGGSICNFQGPHTEENGDLMANKIRYFEYKNQKYQIVVLNDLGGGKGLEMIIEKYQ